MPARFATATSTRRRNCYATPLKANIVHERHTQHPMMRPMRRSSDKPQRLSHRFASQARPWDRTRRVVPKIEGHPGEMFPREGFIVPNFGGVAKPLVDFCNRRSTAEQWIKEVKEATRWTPVPLR